MLDHEADQTFDTAESKSKPYDTFGAGIVYRQILFGWPFSVVLHHVAE